MERRKPNAMLVRLRKLEHQMRILVAAWILSVAFLVLLWSGTRQAASQPAGLQVPGMRTEILETKAINVVDKSGKVRIALGTGPDGSANLIFVDSAGRVRGGIDVGQNATLRLVNAEGKPSIRLSSAPKGVALFTFYDAVGNPRIEHIVAPDGGAILHLFDSSGHDSIVLSALPAIGHATLTIYDATGRVLFRAP